MQQFTLFFYLFLCSIHQFYTSDVIYGVKPKRYTLSLDGRSVSPVKPNET
jgi:hypothetical protein